MYYDYDISKNIQNQSYRLKKITLKGNLASKEWEKLLYSHKKETFTQCHHRHITQKSIK